MASVLEQLTRVAQEERLSLDDLVEEYVDTRMNSLVPARYRALTREVLLRMPISWDADMEVMVWAQDWSDPNRYAWSWPEERDVSRWLVVLNPPMLDRLSDAACRWVVAHEFGHIAHGVPEGDFLIEPDLYRAAHDRAANDLAAGWGFTAERDAFLAEDI